MIGRDISRRKALAMRQMLVDAVPDSQEYAAAFDSDAAAFDSVSV
jgi:hypothetical protein